MKLQDAEQAGLHTSFRSAAQTSPAFGCLIPVCLHLCHLPIPSHQSWTKLSAKPCHCSLLPQPFPASRDTNLLSPQQAIRAELVNRQGHMGNVWVCEGDSYAGASPLPQATDRDGQTPVVTLFHCGVKFPSGSSYGPSHHPNQLKGWQGLKKWEVLVPSHAFIFAVVSLKIFWFCEALPACRCL